VENAKVENAKSETQIAKRETPGLNTFNDFFAPMFPVGRFFGVSPFAMMREFTEEMDRMFTKGSFAPSAETAQMQAWAPTVDVQRCNGNLVVTAELPGLKKEEVKVEMTGNAVIIQGERKREHTEDHKGFHRFERSYGKFYRSIPLPEGAKTEQAKAELTDGVLKISVPAAEAKPAARQIPVQAGTAPAKTSAAA
jgi:HSP20 family protein